MSRGGFEPSTDSLKVNPLYLFKLPRLELQTLWFKTQIIIIQFYVKVNIFLKNFPHFDKISRIEKVKNAKTNFEKN